MPLRQGLSVIVLPKLLDELLDQADRNRTAHLALDFVQHVLEICQEQIEEPVMAARLLQAYEQLCVRGVVRVPLHVGGG
jgi:hypothetical protein